MANVVKDSGEGRCFLQLGDAMGAAKKVVLEPLARALGERLFYIMLLQCIRDFEQQQDSSLCTIMPHYVTKLWEKFLLPCTFSIRSDTFLAYKNFLERWEGVATENLKRQFTTKRKSAFSLFKNEISEMKQTKN